MDTRLPHPRLWSVVLAGGDGERMRPWIETRLGRHLPKQYCTFLGTRSMFQHTIDRADRLTLPGRRVAVIARSHEPVVRRQMRGRTPGIVVVQPANRDTAAGVLIALARLRALDPKATVVLFPSDHFVYPEDRFLAVVSSAVRTAEALGDHLVLLGVQPDRPELEYGWIETGPLFGDSGPDRLWRVRTFLEKPTEARARAAMRSGALWNTLVVAARLETLWRLAWRCLPELMPHFERLSRGSNEGFDSELLEETYRDLPKRNISSDLLARVPDRIAALELRGVSWNDWGTPERILETMRAMEKEPALQCAAAS